MILAIAALAAAVLGGRALWAQVSGDRGIAPVASSTDIEVGGIEVDATGDSPGEARRNGWQQAARKAWEQIEGPDISDSRLDSLVSAIVVEDEQIGPRRYIATLGVIFDRQRAGGMLGGGGERSRSAPMLTLPVMISGGSATMFEMRNPWQRAWAGYQAGASAIDYVRPSGAGGESLLLTYGQVGRRSRAWWNVVLDEFGAADVLVPIANLRWEWPGGPVEGRFTARYGPDNRYLDAFSLRAETADQLPEMLNRAVRRFDEIYTEALADGTLQPDPTLTLDEFEVTPEVRALIEAAERAQRQEREAREEAAREAEEEAETAAETPEDGEPAPEPEPEPQVSSFTVQVATPDAAALDTALGGVRGTAGVRSVATSSVAVGGTSVLRVTYAGSLSELAGALRAGGWQVTEGSNALSISR